MLEVGWGMVNPDMFQAVADTLEDVMQASVSLKSLSDWD
jgi:hypothetical protein